MRDDSQRWPPLRDARQGIDAPGLAIKEIGLERLTLLSGPRAMQQTSLPLISWPDMTKADRYALCLRRDRILEVNGPTRTDGWDNENTLAISDVTDSHTVLQLSGPNAQPLLNRGTELDIRTPSRSTARLIFGFEAILHQHSDKNTFRLHVSASHGEALWNALHDISQHLN